MFCFIFLLLLVVYSLSFQPFFVSFFLANTKHRYVDDESFIDMATSISGSGPAYIFLLMESMIDGAVHMGFPRDKATTLVYHTM